MPEYVKLTGFRELHDALGNMTKATERSILRRVAIKALQPVVETAKALVPVDDGDLRDSIVVGPLGKSRSAKATDRLEPRQGVRMFAGSNSRNAVAREFGSERSRAQPYMRPAWDARQGDVLKIVETDLGAEIERTAERLAKKGKAK